MTEPIEQMLRETFRADADATAPAGDLAGAARRRLTAERSHGRWQVLGAAAAALLVVTGTGLAVAWRDSGPNPLSWSSGSAKDLAGTEWRLVEYTVGGTTRTVPTTVVASLGFDGAGQFSGHTCNRYSGDARITDTHVDFSNAITTNKHCEGALGEVEAAVHAVLNGRVAWAEDGDRLRLRQDDGDTLVYEKTGGLAGPDNSRNIASGVHDGVEYRFLVSGTGDGLSLRVDKRTGRGAAWESAVTGPRSGGDPAFVGPLVTMPIGDSTFVGGFAPATTVRLGHRVTSTAPVERELSLYPLDGTPWRVFGGLVTGHSGLSVITAYDGDGRIVGRWQR